jgi:hypothetical protein
MVRVFAVKSLLPVAECDDDLKSKVVKTNRTTVSAPPLHRCKELGVLPLVFQ